MTITIIKLIVIFQLKHLLADYPLQTKYMLGKFKEDGWALPLLAHVAVHAGFTYFIAGFFVSVWQAVCLALFDAVVHFVMDRIKASPKMLGRFKPLTKETYLTATEDQIRSNTLFWWSLGFDQFIHGLTDTVIVYLIVRSL